MSPEVAACLYVLTFVASAAAWVLARFGRVGWAS